MSNSNIPDIWTKILQNSDSNIQPSSVATSIPSASVTPISVVENTRDKDCEVPSDVDALVKDILQNTGDDTKIFASNHQGLCSFFHAGEKNVFPKNVVEAHEICGYAGAIYHEIKNGGDLELVLNRMFALFKQHNVYLSELLYVPGSITEKEKWGLEKYASHILEKVYVLGLHEDPDFPSDTPPYVAVMFPSNYPDSSHATTLILKESQLENALAYLLRAEN